MARRLKSLWPQGGLWRHPDFLRLWAGQTISQFGSQISALALPITAIVVLDATAFQVALLGTVEFLPFLLFTLPAGVWVDRLRRRPILVIADLVRAAVLVSVPVAYALDALTIWQLYIVGFVVGTGTVFFDVAYQSYLPSLVRRNQLVEGNSKLELSVSAAQLGGPAAAGGLVSLLSAPWAVLTDAISFLGSALFVLRIRTREEVVERPPAAERPGMRADVWEGMQFVWRERRLRALTESTVIFNFCANGAFAVYLVYAVRSLGLSPAAIGVIFSLGNVGWLAGALVAGRLSTKLGVGRALILSGACGRSGADAGPAGAAIRTDPVPDRIGRAQLVRSRHLADRAGEPPPGDHSGSHAGAGQRREPVHDVGDDPAGHAARRRSRLDDRPSRDPLARDDRRVVHDPAGAVLARAHAHRDSDDTGRDACVASGRAAASGGIRTS